MNVENARDRFVSTFLMRLRSAIDAKGMTDSEVSLAARGDGQTKTVGNMFSQRSVPRADIVVALAKVLDTSTDYLLGVDPSVTVHRDATQEKLTKLSDLLSNATSHIMNSGSADPDIPFLDSVLAWYRAQDGVLKSTDKIAQYCDVYRRPVEDQIDIIPHYIGENSELSKTIGGTDHEKFNRLMASIQPETSKNIRHWHTRVADEGIINFSVQTLEVELPTGATIVKVYDRLLLPVRSPDGHDLILTFARPISSLKKVPQFVVEL